jgi:hypothetical protein
MKRAKTKKMTLTTETIMLLDARKLSNVAGGDASSVQTCQGLSGTKPGQSFNCSTMN